MTTQQENIRKSLIDFAKGVNLDAIVEIVDDMINDKLKEERQMTNGALDTFDMIYRPNGFCRLKETIDEIQKRDEE